MYPFLKLHLNHDLLQVGRLLMRKVLSESFVLSNSEIKLGRTGNGKPYVVGDEYKIRIDSKNTHFPQFLFF